ncbi:acyltransferase family protein [Chryseobacterium sp. A301]
MKRDLYIDFAKGFATLSVIFIHTVFWSGQYYVPTEVRILSLLIDVPLFYALSGLTSSGKVEKTLFRLLKLQITYMIFVTLLFFLDYLFKVVGLWAVGLEGLQNFYSTFGSKYTPGSISTYPQWQNLGNWYLHRYTNADTFPVVMGSFWYLKVYFILTVLGVLILRYLPRHINWIIGLCLGLTVLFYLFPHYYPKGQVGYVTIYLAMFLCAHQIKGKKLSRSTVVLLYTGVGAAIFWLFQSYGTEIFYRINKEKFPPKIPYIVWTLFSIVTLFVLYNRLKINKNNFVTYIGENAIFFYFAQGISSSLIYFVVVPFQNQFPWGVFLILIFLLNATLAFGLAVVLKKVDALGWDALRFLKEKTTPKTKDGF